MVSEVSPGCTWFIILLQTSTTNLVLISVMFLLVVGGKAGGLFRCRFEDVTQSLLLFDLRFRKTENPQMVNSNNQKKKTIRMFEPTIISAVGSQEVSAFISQL
ncbi:hypothetical protein CHARACLAT_007918 [Characodon lateralis]|uniref:Secreted protein n=1 Tax=Characodon lateralis TaxID=208331 RepID=A0ABU7D7V6_9TELE|nr:hypothetical protein [Characodon lateralis]